MKTKLYHVVDEYFQILEDNNLNINNEVVWNKEESRPYFYIVKAYKNILWLAPITSRYKEHLKNSHKYPDYYEKTYIEGRKGFMRLEKAIPVPRNLIDKDNNLEIEVDLHQVQNKFNRILIDKRNQKNKKGKVYGLDSIAILEYFTDTSHKEIKLNKSQKIEFKNFTQLEEQLNAVKKKNYYICDCPKCNKHEAYIYESNLNVIHCNRQNECGENTIVKYQTQSKIIMKESKDDKQIERKQLAGVYNILFAKTSIYESLMRVDNYRGLNFDQITDVYDMTKLQLLNDLKQNVDVEGLSNYYQSQLAKFVSDGYKRNIIHVIRNDKDKIERVLLRSNTKELDIKEKQVTLTDNASGIFKHNLDNEVIIICESHIDAMSVASINNKIGYIALTGVNRTNQLFDFIDQKYEQLFDKRLIVAMDNDKAGNVASNKIRLKLEELGIINCTLRYKSSDKDLNEMLNNNIDKLKLSINESYSYISNISFNDKQQKIRQTTKHINKRISLASMDTDKLVALTNKVVANSKLSIENHIICDTKQIDSTSVLPANEIADSRIELTNDSKPLTGYHTSYIKGFFDGRQFKSLNQASEYQRKQINNKQINLVTKTIHYLREDLYKVEITKQQNNLDINDEHKLKGVIKFAKTNGIEINVKPCNNDVDINYDKLVITINESLSDNERLELSSDCLSNILVKLENIDSRSNFAKRYELNLNSSLRKTLGLKINQPQKYKKPLTTSQTKKIIYSSSKLSNQLQSTINLEARRYKEIIRNEVER